MELKDDDQVQEAAAKLHALGAKNVDRVNGTGDTFSAIIAAELAKGHSVEAGVRLAKKVVHEAIANEIEVGHQFGPINHWAGQEAAN